VHATLGQEVEARWQDENQRDPEDDQRGTDPHRAAEQQDGSDPDRNDRDDEQAEAVPLECVVVRRFPPRLHQPSHAQEDEYGAEQGQDVSLGECVDDQYADAGGAQSATGYDQLDARVAAADDLTSDEQGAADSEDDQRRGQACRRPPACGREGEQESAAGEQHARNPPDSSLRRPPRPRPTPTVHPRSPRLPNALASARRRAERSLPLNRLGSLL
jgi:hypothetical protein